MAWVDYAKSLLSKRKQTLDDLKGKRIRIIRVVVFEGEAEAVFKQLSRSLPIGEHKLPIVGEPYRGRALNVTIVQDEMKILDE
jgi:hypothetical protein